MSGLGTNGSIRWIALLVVCLVSVGCGVNRYKNREAKIKRIDEAGSVRVSVVSVAEWDEYVDALMPNFSLSAEQALGKVVPDTRLIDERRLRGSRTEVKAGFSGLASGETAGDRVKTPGTTEGLDTSGSSAGERTASGMSPIAALEKTDLDATDPMLQYAAANSLYQEVKFLNAAVRHAANRENFVPYVLRMKVGLMPRRRNLPYDTYVNLSIFTEDIVESMSATSLSDLDMTVPLVVPLLVTDSLEASTNSTTLGRLIEASVALQGTTGTTAFGFNQGFTMEDLVSALGRDLNSLFMVSRLSDNTIRLRLGANQQISSNYAMVPRNHTVTLLVLLPTKAVDEKKEHLIQARTEMVHVRTGKALKGKGTRQDRRDVERIVGRFGLCKARKSPAETDCKVAGSTELDPAYFYAVANDWAEYRNQILPSLWHAGADRDSMLQIWSELVNLSPGYYEDEIQFSVPPAGTGDFPQGQAVLLNDDTKKKTSATVVGGTNLRASKVCAALHFVDSTGSKALIADAVSIDGTGEVAKLDFKSIKALGLAKYSTEAGKRIELRIAYAEKDTERAACWTNATAATGGTAKKMSTIYHAAATTPTPSGMKITWVPQHVVSSKGSGTLFVEIESTKDAAAAAKAVLEISKATVTAVSATLGTPKRTGNKVEVPLTKGKKTRLSVSLGNLDTDGGVDVKVSNGKKVKQGEHFLKVKGS